MLFKFSFNAKPGTVGAAAVPAKSPVNCILPFTVALASAIVAPATWASTYVLTDFTLGYFVSDAASVVTSILLFNLSSFNASAVFTSVVFAFKFKAAVTSVVFAFKFKAVFTSVVFAFTSSAVCVAVDTGLSISLVLSALARPTIALVIPFTVPVKVGDSIFAFKLTALK